MISDVRIDDNPEKVYDLNSIGIEGELIITPEKTSYILTNTDYFPTNNIIKGKNEILIKNEESSIKLNKEQFSIIEKVLVEIN